MKVEISPRAERSIKSLPSKDMQNLLKGFIEVCNHDWWKDAHIKHIVSTPFYRYKSGKYRIIFDQEGNIITVYDVRRRSEYTYKDL